MPTQSEPPLRHCNRYTADSACLHCDGVIRCEPWCATQSENVNYAFQLLSDATLLSLVDQLSLHALGVAWVAPEQRAKR
jgi:hypothetical protein